MVTDESIEIFPLRFKSNPKVKGFMEYIDKPESDEEEEYDGKFPAKIK